MNITVKDRFTYLENPDPELVRKLKNAFSYMKKSARFMSNPEWGRVKLYDEKRNRFPVGLGRRFSEIYFGTKDDYKIEYSIAIKGLRPYQCVAVQAIFEYQMGIVRIPTGGGKTKVAIEAIKTHFHDKKVLVIVPTIDLKIQWEKQCGTATVRTYQSIKDRKWLQSFDVVFMDECHHAAAKTIFKIGMNIRQDARIYGLSATPFLREEDNLKVEAVLGPIIYQITEQELIEQGWIIKPNINFIDLPIKQEKFYLTYKDAYEDLIVNNEERNNQILKLLVNSGKTLILVSRIEHGEALFSILKINNHDVVFLSGEHTKLEREDTDHAVIIATSIYEEGVDLPQLNTLIVATGGKSDIKTIQRVGRLLRPSTGKTGAVIYDFIDKGKFVYLHAKSRMKLLSKVFGNDIKVLPPL